MPSCLGLVSEMLICLALSEKYRIGLAFVSERLSWLGIVLELSCLGLISEILSGLGLVQEMLIGFALSEKCHADLALSENGLS